MGFATSLIVRTAGDESATIGELRTTLARTFPAAEPVVRSMRSYLEPQYRKWRVGAMLFSAVGILALVVALIGIYSTMTYAVAQRTHEFGVRIAHGAVLGDLLKQVMGESIRVVFIGVVAGIVMAFAASRLIESLLYGVSVHDIPTTIGVSLSMLAAAALATVGPAMRAARVDPVESLRAE